MRCCFLTVFLLAAMVAPLPAVNNRSVSGSQQFTVICPDRSLREKLASAFDEVRKGLFSELGVQLGASTRIYVTVSQRKIAEYSAPAWNMRWLDAPDGARIQLDVLVDDEMREQRLQEHIVSALLLTLKYRDRPPSGGESYEEPANWLVEGLSEKIRLQTQDPDATLYRGLLNGSQLPNLLEWMTVNPATLDATSLSIYRAYACALVSFFESEAQGKKNLLSFLQKAPREPVAALDFLTKAYPNLGPGGKNLPKWWSLSLAKLSASDRYEAWSGPQTEQALNKSLTFRIFDRVEYKTFTLDQFADFQAIPGHREALAVLGNDLLRLTVHAHPLFRPVIVGYQDIVGKLQREKTKGVAEKLVSLATLRTQLSGRLEDVSDYLTLLEATQKVKGPGEFDGYFKLMQSFQAARQPSREPIGQYLDSMEAELKN